MNDVELGIAEEEDAWNTILIMNCEGLIPIA